MRELFGVILDAVGFGIGLMSPFIIDELLRRRKSRRRSSRRAYRREVA